MFQKKKEGNVTKKKTLIRVAFVQFFVMLTPMRVVMKVSITIKNLF